MAHRSDYKTAGPTGTCRVAATAAEANTVAQVVWEAVKVAALAALADRVERAAEWVVVASGAVAAAAAAVRAWVRAAGVGTVVVEGAMDWAVAVAAAVTGRRAARAARVARAVARAVGAREAARVVGVQGRAAVKVVERVVVVLRVRVAARVVGVRVAVSVDPAVVEVMAAVGARETRVVAGRGWVAAAVWVVVVSMATLVETPDTVPRAAERAAAMVEVGWGVAVRVEVGWGVAAWVEWRVVVRAVVRAAEAKAAAAREEAARARAKRCTAGSSVCLSFVARRATHQTPHWRRSRKSGPLCRVLSGIGPHP